MFFSCRQSRSTLAVQRQVDNHARITSGTREQSYRIVDRLPKYIRGHAGEIAATETE